MAVAGDRLEKSDDYDINLNYSAKTFFHEIEGHLLRFLQGFKGDVHEDFGNKKVGENESFPAKKNSDRTFKAIDDGIRQYCEDPTCNKRCGSYVITY
ncbi:MAG: hypothetical protein ACPGSD_02855 [Flavobacteriales bacterium]